MPRKKKATATATLNGTQSKETAPPGPEQAPAERLIGRMASEIQTRRIEWLWHPWIPKGMLSLIVGEPCVGKSTFIAALITHATGGRSLEDRVAGPAGRVVFLPGYEEDIEIMTIPRLRRAGARLDRVKILDDNNIALVRDKKRLAGIVSGFEATLLIGDPIDSYVDEGLSEDSSQHIRPVLEAAVWIARETGAAVCFARHPGKKDGNIMAGSRMWRAVPRSIVQLTRDGAIPPRYILSHYKDSLGTDSTPRRYNLVGDGLEPPRFAIEEEIDRSAEELQRSAGGPTGRYKLMAACRLIRWLFGAEAEPTRQMLGDEARKNGLGEDTVNEALRLLGVRSVPPEQRGLPWKLVRLGEDWPSWLPETGAP